VAVFVDGSQIEWPLLLHMAMQNVDDVVSCHHVTVHVLLVMAAIKAPDILGLSNKPLALGTALACIVFVHANNQVAERACLCNGKRKREGETCGLATAGSEHFKLYTVNVPVVTFWMKPI